MTNEYATKVLKRIQYGTTYPVYKALDMAIEALQRGLENVNADSCSEKPNRSDLVKESSNLVKNLVKDTIYRQDAKDRLTILVNEIEGIFADIRERNVDDSVCGLCEYDCDHGIDGSAFECLGFERDDCFKLKDKYREEWTDVKALPSAQPERKKGEWCHQNDDYYDWYECSECGYGDEGEMVMSREFDVRTNFCPNCGADMR